MRESTSGVPLSVDKAPNGVHEAAPNPLNESMPHSPSFSQVAEMIASGRPIEGIRDIPDTLLVGQASSSTARERKKPWERAH